MKPWQSYGLVSGFQTNSRIRGEAERFVWVECPGCKSKTFYPWPVVRTMDLAKQRFYSRQGRRCSCTLGLDEEKWQDQAMLHSRNKPNGNGGGRPYEDEKSLKNCPSLVEFLTVTQWSPDEPRQPGSVNIFATDGQVKVCFNDKDANMTAFASIRSLVDVVKEMEILLTKDDLDWRQNRWDAKKGKASK